MKLKAGKLNDFNNSMAAAIENAFESVWTEHMGSILPEHTRKDRRMLFVAIAQGVIKHLHDNAGDAFDLNVTVEQSVGGPENGPLIESDGQATGGHTHNVSVTQQNVSDNKMISKTKGSGTGTVSILYTGDLY